MEHFFKKDFNAGLLQNQYLQMAVLNVENFSPSYRAAIPNVLYKDGMKIKFFFLITFGKFILVFHDSISNRSVRSLSGFLLLIVACVNDLTMCSQSGNNWKY